MGFLKKIGGALGKLPGSKMLTKPINKLASKTPGMKGMPAAFGMKPASPIAPSPNMMQGAMGAASSMSPGGMKAQSAPPPMMEQPGLEMGEQPPPMAPPMPMQPIPQGPPQMDLANVLKQRMGQRNTGVNGGRIAQGNIGIGPRFMG
jgi:hypothetical protein